MNRLTSVPINIAPIIAIESGFCNSDPISKENNNGTIAKMVVSEVIIMGRNLRLPASWIASRSGIPVLRNSLIASSFKIESLIMIPHVTIKPIADIRFSVCPHIHSSTRANATSIGISSSTTSGCTKTLELCRQNKIHQQNRNKQNDYQFIQHLAIGKETS